MSKGGNQEALLGDVSHSDSTVEPDNWGPEALPESGSGGGWKGVFDRFSEAVGATRELLYDKELRKKVLPTVLAEGSKAFAEGSKAIAEGRKAIQETTKRLGNNAATALNNALQQMQQSAAPRFSLLVTTNSRRGKERADRNVNVLIGKHMIRDVPQEMRSRFWFVLVTQGWDGELMKHIQPITSRVLIGSEAGDCSSGTAQPAVEPENLLLPDPPSQVLLLSDSEEHQPAGVANQPAGQSGETSEQPASPAQQPPDLLLLNTQPVQAPIPSSSASPFIGGAPQSAPPLLDVAQGSLQASDSTASQSTPTARTPAAASTPGRPPSTPLPSAATASSPSMPVGELISMYSHAPTDPFLHVTNLPDSKHADENNVLELLEARLTKQTLFPSETPKLTSSSSNKFISGLFKRGPTGRNADVAVAPGSTVPDDDVGVVSVADGMWYKDSYKDSKGGLHPVVSAPTNAAAVPIDTDWEQVDRPERTVSGAATEDVRRRLEELSQQFAGEPLESLFRMMHDVPWDPEKGLVCMVPANCMYMQLCHDEAGQYEVDDVIKRDINRTFPEHPLFGTVAGQMSLYRVLRAYSMIDTEVAYCQGMAFAAGVMLMYLPEEPAFRLYCRLMCDEGGPNLRRLYLPGLEGLKKELARFDNLLAVTQPELQAHLEAYGVPPVLYVSQWLMTVYASPFVPSFCAQLIEIMIQDGHDAVLMRVALTIMDVLAPYLLQMHDFEHILTYIKVTPAEWDDSKLTDVLQHAVVNTWCRRSVLTSTSLRMSSLLPTTNSVTMDNPSQHSNSPITTPSSPMYSPAKGADNPSFTRPLLDPEDLCLDQEIAQMVMDLNLRVPPATNGAAASSTHTAPGPSEDSHPLL